MPATADARVREEHVDSAVRCLGLLDEPADIVLLAHVGDDREPVDVAGDRLRGVALDVGDDHRARAGPGKRTTQRLTETVRPTGHDHDPVGELHHASRSAPSGRAHLSTTVSVPGMDASQAACTPHQWTARGDRSFVGC